MQVRSRIGWCCRPLLLAVLSLAARLACAIGRPGTCIALRI